MEWATMLESGEFEQGTGVLNEAGNYCCLGVLCEAHKRATGNGEWHADPPMSGSVHAEALRYVVKNSGNHSYSIVPQEVCHWAGLAGGNPVLGAHPNTPLATFNDGLAGTVRAVVERHTFKQIAALIRAHWAEL